MENASKALIIAGAILLSILIIALGIYVFNLAKTSTNTDQLDNMSIATFNSQFVYYEGKQSGMQVKVLLDNALSNYEKNKDVEERIPAICYKDVTGLGPKFACGSKEDFGQGDEESEVRLKNDLRSPYDERINQLKANIADSHLYLVTIEKSSSTGLVNRIVIDYDYIKRTK